MWISALQERSALVDAGAADRAGKPLTTEQRRRHGDAGEKFCQHEFPRSLRYNLSLPEGLQYNLFLYPSATDASISSAVSLTWIWSLSMRP